MEIDFSPTEELEFGLSGTVSPDVDFGTGGVEGAIDLIKVNGQPLPVVNRTVDVPVPTKTSQLTNDSGYITNAGVPTKTSQLTNDSGYITSSDIPVTSVNGQTGDVTIDTNPPLIITFTFDPNSGFVWSGADTPLTVTQAFEAGRSVIIVLPQISSESYLALASWMNGDTACAIAVDNDVAFIVGELNPDFSASVDQIDLQKKLTAGNNISINNSTISATDTTYTAGTGLSLSGDNEFSIDNTVVTRTTYPSSAGAGAIKAGASWGTTISSTGYLGAYNMNITQYNGYGVGAIIGKGTLETVLDNKPTTWAGYDATRTQVLKNINGTLTWVNE